MSRSGLVWRQLVLPVPVAEARARSFMAALATLTGSPLVVFEAIGSGGSVVWRVGTEPWAVRDVQALALAHLPGVRLVDPSEQRIAAEPGRGELVPHVGARLASDELATTPPAAAALLHFGGAISEPLRVDEAETVTRSLLTALASASETETVRLQLVCGSRLHPRAPKTTGGGRNPSREMTNYLHEAGFVVALRVSAQARTDGRARSLVRGVAASLRGLEVPGARLRIRRASLSAVAEARTSWLLPMQLRLSEIPALLAWPLTPGLPGVPALHPVMLAPSRGISRRGRVIGEGVSEPAARRPVALSVEDSLRHVHLIGPTGVGKSTLMARLALQDVAAGRGVVVIDPKGDLVTDIAQRIPKEHADEVVILDAADEAPVGINPLAGGRDPDLSADVLLGVMHSLYADSWGPRTHDILHASLLTLARRGDASLVMVPLLLTNPGFRRSITGRVSKQDPMGLGAFWAWFEAMSDGERQQAIAPLMNKLRPILLRPQLRAVFGQRRPRFDLRDIFTPAQPSTHPDRPPRVVLVNLAKGALGEEAAMLLGSVIVGLVWQAALGRATIEASTRRPVMVHIDEVQDYLRLPGDLGSALAQARGLGLGFTLAHQHLGQLPTALKAGIMANARSRVAFSLSRDDARTIAALSQGHLEAEDYQRLPSYHAYASLLAAGETQPPLSLCTLPLAKPLHRYRDIAAANRNRFGQTLTDIETDLLSLISTDPAPSVNGGDTARIGRIRRTPSGDPS